MRSHGELGDPQIPPPCTNEGSLASMDGTRLDPLTGLPNSEVLASAVAAKSAVAVFVDIDGLLWLNDSNGMVDADQAVRAVATCIVEQTRAFSGVVARIGGDDFVIALSAGTREDAARLGIAIMSAVEQLDLRFNRYEGTRCPFYTVGVSTLVFDLELAMLDDRRSLIENLSYALWEAKVACGRSGQAAGILDHPLRQRPPHPAFIRTGPVE